MKTKTYEITWRNKWVTADAKTIDEMIAMLRASADCLEKMQKDGIVLEDNGSAADDYACLITTDSKIAKKHGLQDRSTIYEAVCEVRT
jgi:hypothetical protein